MKYQAAHFANHLALYHRICPTCKKQMKKGETNTVRLLLKEYCEFCLCTVHTENYN